MVYVLIKLCISQPIQYFSIHPGNEADEVQYAVLMISDASQHQFIEWNIDYKKVTFKIQPAW